MLPVWLALMTQVPTVRNETLPPEIEQTDEAAASIVNTTGFPEAPPVAEGVYVTPLTMALIGAVEVKEMV